MGFAMKMIVRFVVSVSIGFAAIAIGDWVFAQQAMYPTTIPGVKAPGTVPLTCDGTGKNCAPSAAASNGQVATGTASSNATAVQAADGTALASKAQQASQLTAEQASAAAAGTTADASNCATDTTPVSEISALKCQVTKLTSVVTAVQAMQTQLHADLIAATPAGSATIGSVNAIQSGSWTINNLPGSLGAKASASSLSMAPATDAVFPVTGTFWQTVQPISQSGAWVSTDTVKGDVAAGATDGGNPVKGGCYASATAPTAVTAGQRANNWCDLNGAPWEHPLYGGDTTGGAFVQEKERSGYFVETTTNLAASASFFGTTRDAGSSPSQWAGFSCYFLSSAASTAGGAAQQASDDGASWYNETNTTLSANIPAILATRIFARYHRCVLSNSTTATSSLIIKAQFGIGVN